MQNQTASSLYTALILASESEPPSATKQKLQRYVSDIKTYILPNQTNKGNKSNSIDTKTKHAYS